MILGTKFAYSKSLTSFAGLLLKSCRNIQNSVTKYAKMYIDHENRYAYSVMEIRGYAISLKIAKDKASIGKEQFCQLLEDDEWSSKSPEELFRYFSLMGEYCSENNLCISNKIFDNFIDNLTDNLQHASDKELESIFFAITKWPEVDDIRCRNYIEVWAALDDVCMNRIKSWSHSQILSFMSLFYMLNVTKINDYSKKALQKLATKAKQLLPTHIVPTMFYIGVLRQPPFDLHNLELHIDNLYQEFTVDDLAVMSMGFFKSKTPIRSMDLVSKIIDKIIETSESIHEISLAALIKVIRLSMKITTDDKIYRLLDALQHEVPRLSVMCNVHIALLGTSTLTFHQDCLTKIAERIMLSMSDTRLKDLERLVFTYSTFNFIPPTKECFFQKVMDELRNPVREHEITKYGRSFISCIEYLGIVGMYPVDLMNKALCPEYLEKTYGKQCFSYGRAVLAVHNAAQIFCRGAKINRLEEKVAKILAKKYTAYVPNEDYSKQFNATERMFLDVYKNLEQNQGGEEYVVGDHIVTHHQRGDIIICNNHEAVPQPVKNAFSNESFGLLRRPPNDNHWVVLIIAGRNTMIRGSATPMGVLHSKARELRALGFHVAMVPWSSYTSKETKMQKLNYLNNLIQNSITNI